MLDYKEDVTINGQYLRSYSATGYSPVTETRAIPAVSPYQLELNEKVAPDSTISGTIDGVTANIIAWTLNPQAGEIAVDRQRGLLRFNSADVGLGAAVTYTPVGSMLTPAKLEAVVGSPPTILTASEIISFSDVSNEIPANSFVNRFVTVTGATPGDIVVACPYVLPGPILWRSFVDSANTVVISVGTNTFDPVTVTDETWRIMVTQFS